MKTVALLPSPLAAGGPILAEWLLNTDCRLPGSAFRLSAFRATNEIAPAGTGANCIGITSFGVARLEGRPTDNSLLAQGPDADKGSLCP